MTFDLATLLTIFGGAGGASTVTGFIVRTLVLNRIESLENSRETMGRRFGDGQMELRRWQWEHDAVELYKQGRWPR